MFNIKRSRFLISLSVLIILLSACSPQNTVEESATATNEPTAESPEPATDTPIEIETTAEPALLEGTIGFQAPPTPNTILYAVNTDDASKTIITTIPGDDEGPASFSIEVDAGSYYLFAYSLNGKMGAAYNNLETFQVAAGDTRTELILRYSFPQVPCQVLSIPASPDGLFPAIEGNPDCFTEMMENEETAMATISGKIEYQAPPTPPSKLYLVEQNTGAYLSFDVPGSDFSASFSVEVPAGDYFAWAYTANGLAISSYNDGQLKLISVSADQTTDILLKNSITNPCQSIAIPASPDGLFPALEINNDCIDLFATLQAEDAGEDDGPATVEGTIGYQGPPTPNSLLYILDPYTTNWYWFEILGSEGPSPFSLTIEPGTYLFFAYPVDASNSMAAAYTDSSGVIAEVKLTPSSFTDGINLSFVYPTSPCQQTSIPASPDGRFPAVQANCP